MRYRRTRRTTSPLVLRRRRLAAIKVSVALGGVLALLGGLAWLSNIEATAVQHVDVRGASVVSERDVQDTVAGVLEGFYPLYFSRSNIFLYPIDDIRSTLLERFPHIASVELSRKNLTSVAVSIVERRPFALWCGENYLPPGEASGTCYFLDEDGFIFTRAPDFTAPVFFRYHGALSSSEPVGTQFMPPKKFRNISFFIRELAGAINREPFALALIDGVDMEVYLKEGGRVIFEDTQNLSNVLENAKAAFASDALAVTDAELEYVDFRFGNQAYYKFK